jgi:bifunctional UDP-N-acetylglucosamine pyrophosphorylase / glucosamine-1-phosphate N-acetyltransferase
MSISTIIMAAGKGTRLKSTLPKVLHPLFGIPLLERVLRCLDVVATQHPTMQQAFLLVGHGRDQVLAQTLTQRQHYVVTPVVQEPQLGTGHAVQQVIPSLPITAQHQVLVLSGDVPLLRPDSVSALLAEHTKQANDLTVLVATLDNPTGYGRVISKAGQVQAIVEQKDASVDEQAVNTVNTGIYCLNWSSIAPLLGQLNANNAQGELYLTDTIALAIAKGLRVGTVALADADEMLGVNSRADLALCHDILNHRTQQRLMAQGVSIMAPSNTTIAPEVTIGQDTLIYPGCLLQGDVSIGDNSVIGPNSVITGIANPVRIGLGVTIINSVVNAGSTVGDHVSVGPFAHLRGDNRIGNHVRIGNFVEIKSSTIGEASKVPHLGYVGNAIIGRDVNMAAGSITANYDPIRKIKSTTTVHDGAKVGCNAVLVAPVIIGSNACVAAGSVIDNDVPPDSLAIARSRQSTIDGWVEKTKDSLV